MAIKKKVSWSIFFLILISILPILSATTILPDGTYSSTILSTTGSNLSINISDPLCFGAIIQSDSLYFENLRTCGSLNSISFNITEQWTYGSKNYTGGDLPTISVSDTSATITSNLVNQVNVSVSLSSGQYAQISQITSSNGQTFNFPGVNPNPLTLDNLLLNNGQTTLTITNNKQIQGICEKGGLSLMDSITLVGMILTVLLISAVLGILIGVFTNYVDLDKMRQNIDLQSVLVGVCTIGLTGLLLVTVAYVFSSAYCGALGV